jgi:hypothetical protein
MRCHTKQSSRVTEQLDMAIAGLIRLTVVSTTPHSADLA